METIVLVLMIVISFSFLLKQTFNKKWAMVAMATIAALFVGFMWSLAIEQSKTQITDWLNNTNLMLDTSVILSIEVVLNIFYCMLAVHINSTGKINKKMLTMYRILRWFPGLLIFPVLFSSLVYLIFALPGYSFTLISWSLAGAILVLIPLGAYLIKKVLFEKELRLELLFLTNLLIAILGIIATVNGRTAVQGLSEVNWLSLTAMVIIIFAGGYVGLVIRKYKFRKLNQIK